ncbi:hypothetical protein N0V84_012567 [Fusarium piperis]|uniref:AMP-dependent synthetase/ligase domain-containing protein n=1 Tax=Fusarium piperis TaxID=1435070 RepID=A0A9W8TCA4_9HYPO|nr:hypothetical protein N0V84_012567 [Fusarium piperis]
MSEDQSSLKGASKAPLWVPHDSHKTNVAKFIEYVNEKHHLRIKTYHDLHRWSVESFKDFWRDAYIWLQVAGTGDGAVGPVLDGSQKLDIFPPPRFFPSERFNIAEMLLRRDDDNAVAIHFVREGIRGIERVTWGDLKERTRRVRGAMINSGVVAGDVVGAIISNSVDAMAIALATLSIGAVWSSSSCDLGVAGIVDRYSQVSLKLVFADDGYIYAGKKTNLQERIVDWSHQLGKGNDSLAGVVVIPYCGLESDLSRVYRGTSFEDFIGLEKGEELAFESLPFSHPAFILYSSGTGVAIKVKADMMLQNDMRKTDIVFQYTTTSWVMWILNFVSLSCAKSMLLYDGSPLYPTPTVLIDLARGVGCIPPSRSFDLDEWRDRHRWMLYAQNSLTLPVSTGKKDSSDCIIFPTVVGGSPILPVYAGEIQTKALGMAVDVLDATETKPLSIEATGGAGELVCTGPFPSQPLAFVGTEGQEKYRSSYFDRFGPRVWCQGDFIQRLVDTGGFLMLGRSDGVLNPSGIRFGSAEIYAVTETISDIADSICVGQKRPSDSDERVLLFVKMKPGTLLTLATKLKIKNAIRERYSPRHVPRFIFPVEDIPYTVNGKKCEINVKHIVSGRKAAVSGTVANPLSLKLYEEYQHLPTEHGPSSARTTKL